MSYYCLACKADFMNEQKEEYYRCPNCGSLIYISENDAITDNNYFNKFYDDEKTVEIPRRKNYFINLILSTHVLTRRKLLILIDCK